MVIRLAMPAKLNSYLWQSRHGIFYLRIERNGKESRKSLRTRDPVVAKSAAYRFGAHIMGGGRDLGFTYREQPDGTVEVTTDGTDADAKALAEHIKAIGLRERLDRASRMFALDEEKPIALVSPGKQQTLEEALRDYKYEAGAGKAANTWATYQSGFNKLLAGLGKTTPIASIDGEKFSKWRRETLDGKLSPETISKDLRGIRGLFKWAIKRGRHPGPSPVESADLTPVIKAQQLQKFSQTRQAFTAADLEKIIPAVMTSEKPCGFWIPLIVFMTGARPGEIAEMLLDDIQQLTDGTLSMQIRKAKTVGSARTIPLPPALSGILSYMSDVRRTNPGTTYLFPHLVSQAKNGRWDGPSKDFGKLKTTLGFGRGQDCYSLRHTWITMSDRVGMSVSAARQYTGHIPEKKDAHTGYIKSLDFDELKSLGNH